jgi:hypothetical protein
MYLVAENLADRWDEAMYSKEGTRSLKSGIEVKNYRTCLPKVKKLL